MIISLAKIFHYDATLLDNRYVKAFKVAIGLMQHFSVYLNKERIRVAKPVEDGYHAEIAIVAAVHKMELGGKPMNERI